MIPTLYDFTMVQNQYLVCPDDRAQTMCYSNRRATLEQYRQRVLNLSLDFAFDSARRLIEEKQRGVGRDGARELQQLPLANAERRAALAELVTVTLGEPAHDTIRSHP